jgi:hypothetical protein
MIEHWSYQFSIHIWIINRPLYCIACSFLSSLFNSCGYLLCEQDRGQGTAQILNKEDYNNNNKKKNVNECIYRNVCVRAVVGGHKGRKW